MNSECVTLYRVAGNLSRTVPYRVVIVHDNTLASDSSVGYSAVHQCFDTGGRKGIRRVKKIPLQQFPKIHLWSPMRTRLTWSNLPKIGG